MNRLELIQTALLAAFITISGAIKIPSIIPGSEFQLSAPIAVAICYIFGFKVYLIAGILSSVVGLILGTHTLLNVYIAMIFRIVVALVIFILGKNKLSLLLCGPIASTISRLSLSLFLDKLAYPLIAAAVPGMIYTMLLVIPLTLVLERIKREFWRSENAL